MLSPPARSPSYTRRRCADRGRSGSCINRTRLCAVPPGTGRCAPVVHAARHGRPHRCRLLGDPSSAPVRHPRVWTSCVSPHAAALLARLDSPLGMALRQLNCRRFDTAARLATRDRLAIFTAENPMVTGTTFRFGAGGPCRVVTLTAIRQSSVSFTRRSTTTNLLPGLVRADAHARLHVPLRVLGGSDSLPCNLRSRRRVRTWSRGALLPFTPFGGCAHSGHQRGMRRRRETHRRESYKLVVHSHRTSPHGWPHP